MTKNDDRAIAIERPGREPLAAVLHRPPGPLRGVALFAHCFTCSKDLRAVRTISASLASCGVATLRFDFTGLGESAGDFSETTFSTNLEDLVAAADWLREHLAAPTLLIGHSLGGAAVLAAAHRIDEVKAVATIGAPVDPEHVAELFTPERAAIEAEGQAEVTLAGRTFIIKKAFLDDLAEHCSAERIGALKRALLVFHSPQDNTVGVDNARRIYEAARHPKSFISLDGADHLLTKPADARYVGETIAAWASRYVEPEEKQVERGLVEVETRKGFWSHVQAGPHGFVADEPPKVKGTDEGPTPYDLLLAALGTCTTMTLRMYADRKELPLERVKVTLSHERIHADDCESCESEKGYIALLRRTIELEGDLTEGQRERMMEIADKCPVHRTLKGEIVIETSEL